MPHIHPHQAILYFYSPLVMKKGLARVAARAVSRFSHYQSMGFERERIISFSCIQSAMRLVTLVTVDTSHLIELGKYIIHACGSASLILSSRYLFNSFIYS